MIVVVRLGHRAGVLLSRQRQQQCMFSSIPTRHSRHAPPPACTSPDVLANLTREILESKPGTLFSYEPPPTPDVADDAEYAWNKADVVSQKVEWLIRGHAAHIPNTIMQKTTNNNITTTTTDTIMPISERTDSMLALLTRLEEEGDTYMKLRETKTSAFASPGPTVGMYDTILDAYAQNVTEDTPRQACTLLRRLLDRDEPTALSFNAVLRAIANTPPSSEVRDDALYYAFGTFDAAIMHRNAATYTYMMRIVSKFMQDDNVMRGLLELAKADQVVDALVLEAFDDAATQPKQEWTKFAKKRRYQPNDDTY